MKQFGLPVVDNELTSQIVHDLKESAGKLESHFRKPWTENLVDQEMVVVDINKVKTTCDETLSTLSKADWPHTSWEFDLVGEVELRLENGPLINHVGRFLLNHDRNGI